MAGCHVLHPVPIQQEDVDPNGKFDLIAHGTSSRVELEHNGKKILVNSRTIAKLLKNMPGYKKGQDIRLLLSQEHPVYSLQPKALRYDSQPKQNNDISDQ